MTDDDDDDDLFPRPDTAKRLNVSVRGLDRIPEHELERVIIGRRVLYRRGAIKDFIRRHARGGSQATEA